MLKKELIPHTSAPWQQQILQEYLRCTNINKDSHVLDAACGIGNNLNTIKHFSKNITAFDISDIPLKYAKQRHKNVNFFKSNLEEITTQSDMFDIVICTEAMEHCKSPEKAVHELYRVLKPGGYLILSTQNHMNASALVKFIYETFTKKNWDAWGTHTLDSSYESYISALKLYRLCKHQGFKKEKLRGADYYNAWLSWVPWLYQNYKFMDKHPCFLLGKLPIIKFFGMDFFMLSRK